MKIKKYEVYDMKEALTQIKKDLGPDAVILSTRKIVKNGEFGILSKPMIEVTAAIDYQAKRETYSTPTKKAEENTLSVKKNQQDGDKFIELINSFGLNKFESLLQEVTEIKRQLGEMKNSVAENHASDIEPHLKECYQIMIKNGLDDLIAYKFFKKIEKRIPSSSGKMQIKGIVTQLLSELIPVERDYFTSIRQKVLALIGPTGVGKTTSIAKIAANLALKFQKKVCLISIDTFRIGAVEQLKTYAEIIDVPLFVASSPEDLLSIINDCREYEYVFLDSMGRSQHDTTQITELKNFLDVSPAIKVALVLSMSSNHIELTDTYDRYAKLIPEYVIFTKLDETKYYGPMANLPIMKKIPIMLLTTGQNVPEDMEIPDGRKIAKMILNDIPMTWRD